MLLVYNYVLLKMSTWYSKHVEESSNIWRINNIQCITLVVLYGQFMMHGQRNIKSIVFVWMLFPPWKHLHMLLCVWIVMSLKDPRISKQGTVSRRNHRTLTVLHKLEIIRETWKWQKSVEVMFWYSTGLWTVHGLKVQKDQWQLFMASHQSAQDLFKQQALN